MNRRTAIQSALSASVGIGIAGLNKERIARIKNYAGELPFKHSACRWCYKDIPLEQFGEQCKDLGIHSVELLWPEEWDAILSRGMECAISFGSKLGIPKGFNDPQYHAQLLADYTDLIPKAAEKGITQVICFSGNRNGMDDATGMDNCAVGLEPVVKLAQQHGVTVVMELLNSKVNHPDYMCDYTKWGVDLVEKLGSEHFKLLYDIYHMQIMEGDVIRTIKENAPYISHYHTGGVPGRNEIDDTQELNYKAIVKAIADTGYQGFIGQEFVPTRDFPMSSLAQGVEICSLI